ncbi:hypothetical protein ACFLY9_02890, partial [Patescibacteria group bacterium]
YRLLIKSIPRVSYVYNLYRRYEKEAQDMVNSYNKVIKTINELKYEIQSKPPQIILIPPINIDYIKAKEFRGYRENTLEIIDNIFELISKEKLDNTTILDLRKEIKTGVDGLHFDAFNHRKVANIILNQIKR